MDDLNQAELETLRDIIMNDKLRAAIPEDHLLKLMNEGYIEQRDHGVIATGKARVRIRGTDASGA